jgi:MATE family multidrug resistance protein
VRVANELGAGNGRAKFATIVSVATSVIIGLLFWLLIMIFQNEFALIFSSSKPILKEVNKLSVLLGS